MLKVGKQRIIIRKVVLVFISLTDLLISYFEIDMDIFVMEN